MMPIEIDSIKNMNKRGNRTEKMVGWRETFVP